MTQLMDEDRALTLAEAAQRLAQLDVKGKEKLRKQALSDHKRDVIAAAKLELSVVNRKARRAAYSKKGGFGYKLRRIDEDTYLHVTKGRKPVRKYEKLQEARQIFHALMATKGV